MSAPALMCYRKKYCNFQLLMLQLFTPYSDLLLFFFSLLAVDDFAPTLQLSVCYAEFISCHL